MVPTLPASPQVAHAARPRRRAPGPLDFRHDSCGARWDMMREYQTVIVRLQNRVREDEETLTDLLNERARMHWNFDSLHHLGGGKVVVVFGREA